MNFIKTEIIDRIAHIHLDRGKSNAIHAEMLQELKTAIEEAEADPGVNGLILHGKEGFFSSGLDLITLYQYDEVQMRKFWLLFLDFVYTLAAFKKPSVAAISGHSPAGGCVLAICCDARVMAEGDYIIGLNEVPVGIIVPEGIFHLYSFWIGKANAYRYLLQGKLLKPQEALEVGLVDELVDAKRIGVAAENQLKRYTQFERNTWQSSKQNLRREVLEYLKANQEENIEAVLKQWWSPATRSILKTIIDNLTQKKG